MFKQVELTYDFSAFEPTIDQLTMETHYGKHHATYTNNLNGLVEKVPELAGKTIEEIMRNLDAIPAESRTGIRNNSGGYYNHNLYFSTIAPDGGGVPTGALAAAIDRDFGSFDTFKEKISALALGQFGSGWAWLKTDRTGKLSLSNTANQDNPYMDASGIPIFTIDVWEHAYYLKYKNLRADYVKSLFNVVNWNAVSELYTQAQG